MSGRHLATDKAGFLDFHRRTASSLRQYVLRTLGDSATADDIMQESYLRALASPTLPAEHSGAKAYLFRIASNLIIDHWRRGRKEPHAALSDELGARAGDANLKIDLNQAFLRLALRERQLIWLAHVEGADHAAIAAALGLREASVKVLLHRARTKMAELLRRSGYDE